MKPHPFVTGQATRLGNRKNNQDRCIIVQSLDYALLGLADGMGGHPKGEFAAQIFTDTCESFFYKERKPIANPKQFLSELILKAHQEITKFGLDHSPSIDPRTTGIVVLIQDGTATWAHVGDSRLYLYRDNKTHTRTLDHSYVEKLVQDGVITEAQRETHPQRHYVTRCLGGSFTDPGITLGEPIKLKPKDTIMLCSDGLWTHMDHNMIASRLISTQQFPETVDNLAGEAEKLAHPESDNVTLVALRWEGIDPMDKISQPAPTVASKPSTPITGLDPLSKAIEELTQAIDAYEELTKEKK